MMTQEKTPGHVFRFLAGRLCLEFTNTVDWHGAPRPEERLNDVEDLGRWAQSAGLLTANEVRRAVAYAGRHAGKTAKLLKRALALRESMYRVFVAAIEKRKAADKDLELLDAEMVEAFRRRKLRRGEGPYSWSWEEPAGASRLLTRVLWQVALSAAELLTSPELVRVRQCADDRGCGWLFLDTTRNNTRKWCDIRDCGNRAKARRHYLREHAH